MNHVRQATAAHADVIAQMHPSQQSGGAADAAHPRCWLQNNPDLAGAHYRMQ